MIAEELAKGDRLRSGGEVVANVDHGTFRAVVVRFANGQTIVTNYDVGYDVPLERPAALQQQLDDLADLADAAHLRRGPDASLEVEAPYDYGDDD
jgi:hypothetical protein